MTNLSLGSPIQLDDGSSFDNYKIHYDLSSPFPGSFSEDNSSPSTQSSSVPSSSFLGYTPPTSDEEGDKDADGEYDSSASSSPFKSFPSIVSPLDLPGAHAIAPFALDNASAMRQGTHSSQDASGMKDHTVFDGFDSSYLICHSSLDSINSTLVAGSYLDLAQGGLIAPLYSSELDKLQYNNDEIPRRDSDSTTLSFGSYSASEYSDAGPASAASSTSGLAPLPLLNPNQSTTPMPSPTAGIGAAPASVSEDNVKSDTALPLDIDSFASYFPESDSQYRCTFADCFWFGDNKESLNTHHEEHVLKGIFNCTVANCMKHYTIYLNLQAHQMIEHALPDMPTAPQTSYAAVMQPEADQYFPPVETLINIEQQQVSTNQYEPYFNIAQTCADNVGLGFVQTEFNQAQPAVSLSAAPAPVEDLFTGYPAQPIALPRRASDSNIHTTSNGHISSISWERSMPSLNENEVLCSTPEPHMLNLAPSSTGSAASSAMSTPQQSARKQRQVAFALETPALETPMTSTSEEGTSVAQQVTNIVATPTQDVQTFFVPAAPQADYSKMQYANAEAMMARMQAANAVYQNGVFGAHPAMHHQLMAPGMYFPNLSQGASDFVGQSAAGGTEGYFPPQIPARHYLAQHVNLASIDPTMAMAAAAYAHAGDYHAPSYPPTLMNHIVHQRVARAALPRRGSEASYLASHDAAHSLTSNPYAMALTAALANKSKKVVLPDSIGPIRNKPTTKVRTTLPGPKGQEIPKANRKGSTAADLAQGGYSPETVEGINLAEMKLHPCDFEGCCRVFKRLEHKRRHQRSHTQEKPYQCPVEGCKRFFSRSDNLTQHRRTHERNGRTQRLTMANLQNCNPYGVLPNAVPGFVQQANHVHAA